jgi:hypothetical protein
VNVAWTTYFKDGTQRRYRYSTLCKVSLLQPDFIRGLFFDETRLPDPSTHWQSEEAIPVYEPEEEEEE